MLDPIQINERIGQEVGDRRAQRSRIQMELEWVEKKIAALEAARDCDHRPTMKNSTTDWCPHCGFEWVR